tara:strand:+ start:639 stop:1688 length:1050 start_codon:yes stop_codon:yes gene_type:complete
MSSLFDAIGGLGAIYGFDKGIDDVQDIGSAAKKRAETAATNVAGQTKFKPVTVTSSVGSGAFDKDANLSLTMTPEQQAIQAKLQGFGSSMFDFLGDPAQVGEEQSNLINMLTGGGTDRGVREAEIMSRLQAAQAPEQERARLGLEQRLANQGRLGVQTSMFGGTPEALALEKAIAEQQAGFGVSAMEQARLEQSQQSEQTLSGLQEFRNRMETGGELGIDALTSSYQPLEALLATMIPTLQGADIAMAGTRQGAQLGTSLLEAGMSSEMKAETVAANLRQQQIQAISNLLGGQQANSVTGQTGSTGLIEDLFGNGGMFGGIFGGGGGTSSSTVGGTPAEQAAAAALHGY